MIERLERRYALVWRERDLKATGAGLRGRDAVIAFFSDWMDQWEESETDWELEQTAPDTVLALVTTRGRGRASGAQVEQRFAQVWTFRDGEPARMVLYTDAEKGRRAAGAGP
jgi:ketosteroid isomerase-like protein